MAGGCGDLDGVRCAAEAAVDEVDAPSGHVANVVAAFAGAASVGIDSDSAISGGVMWSMWRMAASQ